MTARHPALLLVAALASPGCPSTGPGDADADADADVDVDANVDADADPGDADRDGPGDGGVDADQEFEGTPGPITLVATEMYLTEERLCDFDGDGSLDNAIADLGSPASVFFATAMNSVIAGYIAEVLRLVVHLPRVEDVAAPRDPGAVLTLFTGVDTDDPEDLTDDFSGEEPFAVHWRSLDACGEPLFFFLDASLDGGGLEATGGSMPVPITQTRVVPARQASLFGVVEPGGAGAEVEACGLLVIHDLGGIADATTSTDLSALEGMLAGGVAAGVPSIPGLLPNVDLDGDGLESFELDETGHIVACIDGDTTRFEGRGCWQDARMADAFAASTLMRLTGAAYAGRQPGWETLVDGTCETPPEESLFDPR